MNQYHQNHGSMNDYPVTDKTVEDVQLKKAVELIGEDGVWANLVKKYHRDVHETQMTVETAKAQAAAAKSEPAPEKPTQVTPAPENAPKETPKNGDGEKKDDDFKEPVW